MDHCDPAEEGEHTQGHQPVLTYPPPVSVRLTNFKAYGTRGSNVNKTNNKETPDGVHKDKVYTIIRFTGFFFTFFSPFFFFFLLVAEIYLKVKVKYDSLPEPSIHFY